MVKKNIYFYWNNIILEEAKDFGYLYGMNVIGGYISPVGDYYQKKDLIPSFHRINMIQLASIYSILK